MKTTAALDRETSHERILRAASAVGMLAGTAPGGVRILSTLCNPRIGADELAALIRKEPALYARVLRVANSAYYLQSRTVNNIEQALLLLGIDAIRGIAAAASLDRAMPTSSEFAMVDLRGVLRHSIVAGVAAEELAKASRPTLASDAFVAGLLHHLGIPIQLRLDPGAVLAMITLRNSGDHRCMRDLEAECCAISHETIISTIAEAWQLPDSIRFATEFHHRPNEAPEPYCDPATLIDLGANLALALGYTCVLEPKPYEWDPAALKRLNLSFEHVDPVNGELPLRIKGLAEALME